MRSIEIPAMTLAPRSPDPKASESWSRIQPWVALRNWAAGTTRSVASIRPASTTRDIEPTS